MCIVMKNVFRLYWNAMPASLTAYCQAIIAHTLKSFLNPDQHAVIRVCLDNQQSRTCSS